jgi:hypothetical protein
MLLNTNQLDVLLRIMNDLPIGFKHHAESLINNIDPTGGLVDIDSQVNMLYRQSVVTVSNR